MSNRLNRSYYNLIFSFGIVILMNCTGFQIKTEPEPENFPETFKNSYNSIGLRDIPSEKMIPKSINMTENFSYELRVSNFANDVYYPVRQNEKVDLILESQFNIELDMHPANLLMKTILLGCTMFILEPFIYYDMDYKHTGNIFIYKDKKLIKQFSVNTNSTLSFKYWSLFDAPNIENQAFVKARKSMFRQILSKLEKDPDLRFIK